MVAPLLARQIQPSKFKIAEQMPVFRIFDQTKKCKSILNSPSQSTMVGRCVCIVNGANSVVPRIKKSLTTLQLKSAPFIWPFSSNTEYATGVSWSRSAR